MNLKLFLLKYHPIVKWALKGIPRGVYPIYLTFKRDNPEATEDLVQLFLRVNIKKKQELRATFLKILNLKIL